MSIKIKRVIVLLLVVAVIGAAAGIVHGRLKAKGLRDVSTGIENPVPQTMKELISSSDLIVIGTVAHQVNQDIFYGYDIGAKRRAVLDKASLTPLGVPVTDYEIDVEHVILDDGTVAAGRPVILRIIESPDAGSRSTPKIGDRRLFFLGQNPDQKTYGLQSLMHQVDINGDFATYYRGPSSLLPFSENISSEDFVGRTEEGVTRLRQAIQPREN